MQNGAPPAISLAARAPDTLHLTLSGTKVSFLGFRYPLLFPTQVFADADVAVPREIACMKINAIANGGSKRDFIDLYAMAQQEGLAARLAMFTKTLVIFRLNWVASQRPVGSCARLPSLMEYRSA